MTLDGDVLVETLGPTIGSVKDAGNDVAFIFAEAGFESWDAYLKDRVGEEFGIERQQVLNLIQAAVIRPKLPDPITFPNKVGNDEPEWKPSVVKEFARLAPEDKTKKGSPRDLQSLRKQDVQRVAKKA